MSRYRSNSVAFEDEGPNRWDREKFERFRTRAPVEREDFRFDERDRYGPRGATRDVAVMDRVDRRGPRGYYDDDVRYYEEDRYRAGPRRMDFIDEPVPAEVANRALAPYRRPQRPQYIRRQSSLDTFDRRPMPRYGDEYRIPSDVPIPLPIRRPRSPPRRYRDEYEEVYRDGPSKGREYDEYRDIRVKRERRSRSRAPASVRSSSSSSSSFEEITVPEPPKIGKKGKTRMPKRLVHKKVVVEMGLPFEEEDDFIIVQRALTKVYIDEIIEKSKTHLTEKQVYKYTEDREVFDDRGSVRESLPPPPPPPMDLPPPPPPPAASVRAPSPARTERSHHAHHHSHHPETEINIVNKEEIVQSNHIGGPLTVLSPSNRHRDEADIRSEIRELELERRRLRHERERDSDYELVERVDRWDDAPRRESRARSKSVVRVEKDRKGRMALVRSTH